jgi:DTW domain-containing protein YfiP
MQLFCTEIASLITYLSLRSRAAAARVLCCGLIDTLESIIGTTRARCSRCTRPQAACICGWIAPVQSEVALLILQHPMEVDNAKGSARLLSLGVAGTVMVTGEAFDPPLLDALLHADGRSPVLLYPELAGEAALGVPAAPAVPPSLLANAAGMRLVVLDGTWRKSRKMLYQNRLLHALPRLALGAVPASHYLIRKAHTPDQLSTLEACVLALAQLHGDAARFAPLLRGFDGFVAAFRQTGGRLGTAENPLETGPRPT